ncbi:MAG: ABC transporter permease [Oscillospiraceae bacterium]|jgi:ABC-type dipeptide/oligopeptide/nickel transport system permease subunit|nr:ABC transporter permease [Oscillospiraceae bacterium]
MSSNQIFEKKLKFRQDSRMSDAWRALFKNKAAALGLIFICILCFLSVFGKYLMPFDPNFTKQSLANPALPSAEHWLGTDQHGRDILSRIIDGTRISMFVGVVSVFFSLLIGTVIGAIAGFCGGRIDAIVMRFMDMLLAIPSMLLAITLMASLKPGLDKAIISISIVYIPHYALIVRSSVLSEKTNDYAQAYKVMGASNSYTLLKGILPNIISNIIVRATLGISVAIIDLAALGFLGLGVKDPQAEWGTMVSESRRFFEAKPHTLFFPGAMIMLTVLAFNLLGDGLRDALNPKSKK